MLLLNKVSGAKAFDANSNYLTCVPDTDVPMPLRAAPIRPDALPNGSKAAWYVQALSDPSSAVPATGRVATRGGFSVSTHTS